MDITKAQISEIRDLDLIYLFPTDSMFHNQTDKYFGVSVVYNGNKKALTLDYKNEYFDEFLKHILNRYDKEKQNRKIILLGDFTRKFVKDFSFLYKAKSSVQPKSFYEHGIPSFYTNSNIVKHNQVYFKDIFKQLLGFYTDLKSLEIDSISGYNNKYIVKYHTETNSNELYVYISRIEQKRFHFIINNIEGKNISLEGYFINDFDTIKAEWYEKHQEASGFCLYDIGNDTITRKISMNHQTIFFEDDWQEVTKHEIDLLSFYFKLCDIELPEKILKVSNSHFILSEVKTVTDELDESLYSGLVCTIDIQEDEVWIRVCKREEFQKYDNQISGILSQSVENFMLKILKIDDFYYGLVERKMEVNGVDYFSHQVLELGSVSNLQQIFPILSEYKLNIEVTHLDKVKKYIKTYKRGE